MDCATRPEQGHGALTGQVGDRDACARSLPPEEGRALLKSGLAFVQEPMRKQVCGAQVGHALGFLWGQTSESTRNWACWSLVLGDVGQGRMLES